MRDQMCLWVHGWRKEEVDEDAPWNGVEPRKAGEYMEFK
jgi:hypothetical protein